MTIRLETPKEYRETENLVREAFWNVYRPGCDEHYVLHKMRGDETFVPALDYVLEEDGRILAQIVYAKCYVTGEDGTRREAVLFGPVAVDPARQGQGFGSRLIRFTLEKAKQMGFPAVLITGNPDYYRRFGFESASKHGIFYPGVDKNEEAPFFMIKVLDAEKAKALKGAYAEPAVYSQSAQAVEAFDAGFPPKIKEKRPGQLV